MENAERSKVTKVLNLDYSEKDKIGLSNQQTLRKLVGILGVLLPILLFIFLFIDSNYSSPLESISHYYYTRVGSIFIIIVSLLAIFLLVYKGKENIDFYVSAIAGIFALCLLLFPTSNLSDTCCDELKKYAVTILRKSAFRANFHYIASAIFLMCLAFMSLFLFTKSDKPAQQRTKQKKMRNRIYRTCGIVMVLALLVILAGFFKLIPPEIYDGHNLTFWMETVALESFGISWLTKGELFLKDKL